MKSTYLVYDVRDGKKELIAVSKEEWHDILEKNKTLPREQRRFFIRDCINDFGEIDCMYIEVSKSEYDKWHSQTENERQKRNYKNQYSVVPLSEDFGNSGCCLEDVLPDDFNLEGTVLDEILISELRLALMRWQDWANDLLDYYLDGKSRSCSKELIAKYGISYETIAKRKRQLNDFIKNFLG